MILEFDLCLGLLTPIPCSMLYSFLAFSLCKALSIIEAGAVIFFIRLKKMFVLLYTDWVLTLHFSVNFH